MKTKQGASVAQTTRMIRAAYQWNSAGDEWYSAGYIADALGMLDETTQQITDWSEAVLRELARDAGYRTWVEEKRAELQRILGEGSGEGGGS